MKTSKKRSGVMTYDGWRLCRLICGRPSGFSRWVASGRWRRRCANATLAVAWVDLNTCQPITAAVWIIRAFVPAGLTMVLFAADPSNILVARETFALGRAAPGYARREILGATAEQVALRTGGIGRRLRGRSRRLGRVGGRGRDVRAPDFSHGRVLEHDAAVGIRFAQPGGRARLASGTVAPLDSRIRHRPVEGVSGVEPEHVHLDVIPEAENHGMSPIEGLWTTSQVKMITHMRIYKAKSCDTFDKFHRQDLLLTSPMPFIPPCS